MPTYIELYNTIYSSADIEKRVVIACLKQVDMILHEDPATPNHDLRLHWAQMVIANPTAVARKMIPPILINGDFTDGDFTDTDLDWIIGYTLETYAQVV